jgi:uncharacterized protein (TIGR03085 family)
VLRERSVLELAGRLPSERLRRRAEQQIDELVAREPYDQLVGTVESGPSWRNAAWPDPTALVWSVPAVREAANLAEYVVHHEDIRRAGDDWDPRVLPVDRQMALWRRLPVAGRLTLRKVALGLVLAWPSHGEFRARRGPRTVTVTGDPVELALFAFGRVEVAQVDYVGDPDDIARVRGAEIGI